MKNPVLSFRSLAARSTFRSPSNRGLKFIHRLENKSEFEPDEWTKVTIVAIEDLLTFCDHVIALFGDGYAKNEGVIQWIQDVKKVMLFVMQSVYGNRLEVGSATYDDNEELEMIEDVLDNVWEMDADEDGISEFVSKMISFWLEEIVKRGYTIHGLLNGSDDWFGAKLSLEALEKINYPPVYGA